MKSPATVLPTPAAALATGQGVEAVVPVVRLEAAMVVPQQQLEAVEEALKPCQVVALPLPLASLVFFCWFWLEVRQTWGDFASPKKKRQCHEVCVGCIWIESCSPKKNRVTMLFLHRFGKRCDVEALT